MAMRSTMTITQGLAGASDKRIDEAVADADPVILRTLITQLGDGAGLDQLPRAHPLVGGSDRATTPPFANADDVTAIRSRASEMLRALRDGGLLLNADLGVDEFRRLLELTFDHPVNDEQVEYWTEEFGTSALPRAVEPLTNRRGRWKSVAPRVLIVGAGMNGISTAVHLRKAGIPFTIVERNEGVGGTWFENRYPGARVDVDSRAYSYTFAPDYQWKHHYAVQSELLDYFNTVVDDHDLRDKILFKREVTRAQWSDAEGEWMVEVSGPDGSEILYADALVMAVGLFNQPVIPAIPGISEFQGELLHTARWDESFDPRGKKLAVIGTGSSGVQIVAPLAAEVAELHVFQRSGTWLANVPNYTKEISDGERWLLSNFPFYLHWVRILQIYSIGDTREPLTAVDPDWHEEGTVSPINAKLRAGLLAYVESKLADRPDLLAQCVPSYPPMAKRLPKDNGWYDSIKRPHVTLVSSPIAAFDADGIATTAGERYRFDAVVLATGFSATNFLQPMELVGRNGVTLEEAWGRDGARAYLGLTMPHFPNLFMLYGPNTNPRSGSPASWGEMQARYIVSALNHLLESGSDSLEVREDVFDEFNGRLDDRLGELIWSDPRQTSYYVNEFGRIATNGPWLNAEYWKWTRQFDPDQYHLTQPAEPGVTPSGATSELRPGLLRTGTARR